MKKKKFDFSKYSSLLSSLISIVVGLLIAFVIMILFNSKTGLKGFEALITGGMKMGGIRNVGSLLFYATPILCTGVAMCLAFQAGVFNIGGPGQFTTGAFAAVMTSFLIDGKVSAPLTWIIPIITAIIAGALWALIPGLLKAYLNVNVVISTTMFNYIEMYFMVFLVQKYCYDMYRGQSNKIPEASMLPKSFLADLTNNSPADIGIIIAIVAAIAVWVLLEKTKIGYELKACGKNAQASRYAGIKEKRNIMISILISGALCGLGGGLSHLSQAGVYIKAIEATAAEGFTGIAVCCLANNSPIGAILGALFIGYLTVGGSYMQLFGFQKEIVSVITGIIIYFASFSLFLKQSLERILNKKKIQKNKVTGEDLV